MDDVAAAHLAADRSCDERVTGAAHRAAAARRIIAVNLIATISEQDGVVIDNRHVASTEPGQTGNRRAGDLAHKLALKRLFGLGGTWLGHGRCGASRGRSGD